VRRLPVFVAAALLVAACSSNAPSETPIMPWAPPTAAPTPTPDPNRPTPAPVDTSGWVTFAPAGQGFSVALPGQPSEPQKVSVDTPGGKVETTTWSYAGSDYAMAVMVATGSFSGAAPDQILDTAAQTVASQNGARIGNRSSVSVDGNPGLTFTLTGGEAFFDCEIVLVGDDLYAVYYAAPAAPADDGLARALFASLKLTP
jgi:hypothetical protein